MGKSSCLLVLFYHLMYVNLFYVVAKIKAHEIRNDNKAELLKQLEDLQQELAQVRQHYHWRLRHQYQYVNDIRYLMYMSSCV